MEDKFFSVFNDHTTLVSHCPVCNLRYDPLEARMLDESDHSHILYVKCHYCQAAVLAVVITNAVGVSSVGLMTDLNFEDVARFRQMIPISSDDVLEAHQQLHRERALIDHFD